jgi:hypothetical protein
MLGSRWRRVVSVSPRPFYSDEKALIIHCKGGYVGGLTADLDIVTIRKISFKPNPRNEPIFPVL